MPVIVRLWFVPKFIGRWLYRHGYRSRRLW